MGEDTDVWRMNWLPRDGLMRPVCCTSDTPPTRVSELIDPLSIVWDIQALKMHFIPMDWELILNIPLTTRRQPDFWAWHYEKQGCFRSDQRTRCWLVTGKKGRIGSSTMRACPM